MNGNKNFSSTHIWRTNGQQNQWGTLCLETKGTETQGLVPVSLQFWLSKVSLSRHRPFVNFSSLILSLVTKYGQQIWKWMLLKKWSTNLIGLDDFVSGLSAYCLIFLHFPSTNFRNACNHVCMSYPHIISEPDTIFLRFMLRTKLCCDVFRGKKSGVDDQWCLTGYLWAVRRWLDMCEVQLGARAVFKLVKHSVH